MKNNKVSIIIVNYNGFQDTCELIESFRQCETYPYEIIVVDNASHGTDADNLEKLSFPEVKIVRSNKNLGFAGGNNLGVKYATGHYFFFLNNDMVIKGPVLEAMVQRLSANVLLAGVSPMIRFLYDPDKIQYYGYLDLSRISVMRLTEYFDASRVEQYHIPKETEVLHGGAMMFHRKAVEAVGMMTEVFFLFYEEFDWCRRFREAGYKLWYEPSAVVYHKESMTIPLFTPMREYYLARSRMIFTRRNNRGFIRLLSILYLIFISAPNKMQWNLRQRNWSLIPAVWRGTFSGLFAKTH